MDRFVFPTWVNLFVKIAGAGAGLGAAYVGALYVYGTMPSTLNVGYSPKQPVPFSHRLHAGEMKLDCRYCHNTVDQTSHAAVPPTNTCANCHSPTSAGRSAIHTKSEKLYPIRESYVNETPVKWNRVHDLADYVYFNHAAHVNRGVSCVECHGRIDTMDQVYQAKSLSMAFCLDCHRNPEPRLRLQEDITNLEWKRADSLENHLKKIKEAYGEIHASTDCSTCHR